MKSRQQVSRSAIDLIKGFEGLRRSAAQLPDGRWTIGYGHTKFVREGFEVPEKDAEALLLYDLIAVTSAVSDLVFTPLNQNQFDALVSFAFNIGVDPFKSSAVLRRVNEGELIKAAFELETWRRADFSGESIVVDALVRRRAAEKALFLTPQGGFVPTPSPVLTPRIDHRALPFPPSTPPRALVSPLEGAVAGAYEPAGDADQPNLFPVAAAVEELTSRLRALVPDPERDLEPQTPAAEDPVAPFPADIPTASPAPEPAPVAAEPDVTPEPEPAPAPAIAQAETAAPAPSLRRYARTRDKPKSLVPLVALSVLGVVSFGFAIFWRLNAGPAEGLAASAQAISYIAGLIGVAAIFAAAYLILDRLAGDDA